MKLFRKRAGDTFNIDKLTVEEAKIEAREKAKREARRAKGTPVGIWLEYTGTTPAVNQGTRIHLIPLPGKNLHVHLTPAQIAKDVCPTCQQIHAVKTVHLWLNSDNRVMVSTGVLETIERDYPGGLEAAELRKVGGTNTPPALTLNGQVSRREVDQKNERITQWSTNKGAAIG